MRLVEQWNGIESGLDPSWVDAFLALRISSEEARHRAAALLGPAGPGRSGELLRFHVSRAGAGIGPDAARRLLARIDDARIAGRLMLVSASEAEAAPEAVRSTLTAEWEAVLGLLPSDWSDLVVELDLDSSADVDRSAVLCAPLNPIQATGRPGLRFRCASTHGYGASAGMVGRCLARLDEAEIRGSVRITRALSDVHPVGTQGALFVAGRRPE